jgi:hypothetical protein
MAEYYIDFLCNDSQIVSVPRDLTKPWKTIDSMFSMVDIENHTQVPIDFPSTAMNRLVEFTKVHGDTEFEKDEKRFWMRFTEWDKQFFTFPTQPDSEYPIAMHNDDLKIANYMEYSLYLQASAQAYAYHIMKFTKKYNHDVDKLREYLGLPDDLTAEQKEELKKKYAWVYELESDDDL